MTERKPSVRVRKRTRAASRGIKEQARDAQIPAANDCRQKPQSSENASTGTPAAAAVETCEYEVGFAKPPKHTRFQPGQSGNPAGRPKAAKNLKTLIGRELDAKVTVREEGEARQMPKRKVVALQLIKKALQGQDRAIQTLLKIDEEFAAEIKAAAQVKMSSQANNQLSANDEAILAEYEEQIANHVREEILNRNPIQPHDDEEEIDQ